MVDEVPDDSPEVQEDDDVAIEGEIQDEGEYDGVDVECIEAPEVPTAVHMNHWGPDGRYVPETQAIIDRFTARKVTRDHRTEAMLWAELFECGLIGDLLMQRGGAKKVANLLGIALRTAHSWRDKLRCNPGWRPWNPQVLHGHMNIKFTEQIADMVGQR